MDWTSGQGNHFQSNMKMKLWTVIALGLLALIFAIQQKWLIAMFLLISASIVFAAADKFREE